MSQLQHEQIILQLHKLKCIQFGNFILHSRQESPIYLDLRPTISDPALLYNMGYFLVQKGIHTCHRIMGVSYGGLALATIISQITQLPLLMLRKERKGHGTKRLIEGNFNLGEHVWIIDDVLTSGKSILDAVKVIKIEGLIACGCSVLVNREQGGVQNIAPLGVTCLYTCGEVLQVLLQKAIITQSAYHNVLGWLRQNPCQLSIPFQDAGLTVSRADYLERSKLSGAHPLSVTIYKLMENKCSNLCLAADMTQMKDIINLLEKVGDKIIILKLHCDTINDWHNSNCVRLFTLAKQKHVLLWEDRKFADIAHIVSSQYFGGLFRIASWANLVSVHTNTGPGILQNFPQNDPQRAVLLVENMSSSGQGCEDRERTNKCLTKFPERVAGVISQNRDPELSFKYLCVMPGIHLSQAEDGQDQNYRLPSQAFIAGADIIVVGRGITTAQNYTQAAEAYRQAGWTAYFHQKSQSLDQLKRSQVISQFEFIE